MCPMCKKELESAEMLQAHFQSDHESTKNFNNAAHCMKCKTEFKTLFNRPHECTVCAKIVCHTCSPHRWHVSCIPSHRNVNSKTMVRVCLDCVEATKKLHSLIEQGHSKDARKCFRENCTISFLNRSSAFADENNGRDQLTPLHLAAKSESVSTMKWLIEQHSCNPNVQSADKITPLEILIQKSNLDATLYLFSKGAQVEAVQLEKPLRKMLIKTMDRVFLLDPSTHMLKSKQVETRKDSRSSESEERNKNCPICENMFGMFRHSHPCCACGRNVCGSCSPNRWHESCLPADRNFNNKTYIRICKDCQDITKQFHEAIVNGDCKIVREMFREHSHRLYLSSCSAFIGENPKKQMFTPLHGAASSGSIEMLSFIVEENSCIMDIRTKCAGGSTPLETAAACGHFNAVMYLYKKGGDLNSIRSVRLVKCLLRAALKRLLMLMMTEDELKKIRSKMKNKMLEKSEMKKKKLPPAVPKVKPVDFMKKKKEEEEEKDGKKEKHAVKKKPPPLPIFRKKTEKVENVDTTLSSNIEPAKENEDEMTTNSTDKTEMKQVRRETIPPILPIATKKFEEEEEEDDDENEKHDPFESQFSKSSAISSLGSMFMGEDIENNDSLFDMFDDLTPDVPSTRQLTPTSNNEPTRHRILRHHKSSSLPDPCVVCGSNQDTFDCPRVDCVDKTLGRLSLTFCYACTRSCAICGEKIGRQSCTAFTRSEIEELEEASGKGEKAWSSLSLFCSEACVENFAHGCGDE